MIPVLRGIFRVNLGVRKTERCLVFTDRPAAHEKIDPLEEERRSKLSCLAFLASEIGRGLVKDMIVCEFPATGVHGAEPPRELWDRAFGRRAVEAIANKDLLVPLLQKEADEEDVRRAEAIITRFKDDAVDAVVALSNYSTSHTRFRHFLTRICRARYASMPLFDVSMLEGPMNIDWKQLAKVTKNVAAMMQMTEGIEISSDNGTRLTFSVKGRKALADTGILTKPGSFGNLPAGEAYIAPVEGSASGKLVLEWAPTRALESPVTLIVRDGFVSEVSGDERFAGQLRAKLSERKENGNIAELGIGTNTRARRPDNILESEKIMGTMHVALGDNSSFGGQIKTPFHQDFIFFRPTVVLSKKNKAKVVVMRKGRLLAG